MAKEESKKELPWQRERGYGAPQYQSPPPPPAPPPPPWGDVTHMQIYEMMRESFEMIWNELEEIKKALKPK